jgi:AraC-like DNA-binding protein
MPVGGACFYALTPEHVHPSYMFVINFDDTTRVRLNGQVITGMPGRIFALSPGIPHQELPSERPPRYIAVMIAKDLFESQYRLYNKKKPPVFRGNFFHAGPAAVQLCKKFMIEADNRMPGGAAVLHALSIEISHAVIRQIVEAPAQKDRLTHRVEVNRVIEYLHSHLDEKITLEALARIGHLSASHFSRVFREETGQSPMEYVQNLRLQRAKKLLLAGDNSITDIALECGFNSPSYLSACFQKQYKLTPSEYQKRTGQRI